MSEILIEKKNSESNFEYELRLCKMKLSNQIDLTWQQITNKLGLNIHYDTLRKIAYGYKRYEYYMKNKSNKDTRILSISDLHIPFQLPIETFQDYIGVDILQLNGDLQDCHSISKFPKKYRINFVEEMIETRQYLIDLINYIKPKKVYINYGNHENRLSRFLSEKLNEDILNLFPDSTLDLIVNFGFRDNNRKDGIIKWYEPIIDIISDIDIVYTNDWKCKIGKTYFIHPATYSSGMLKTTHKAIDYFLRVDNDFDCIVTAHTHKLGSYIQGGIFAYEQGCCADLRRLDYFDGKLTSPQNNGFIYICQDRYGNLIYHKTKLIYIKDDFHS